MVSAFFPFIIINVLNARTLYEISADRLCGEITRMFVTDKETQKICIYLNPLLYTP